MPGRTAIAREVDESVVAARPEGAAFERRFGEGEDGAEMLGARGVPSDRAAGGAEPALLVNDMEAMPARLARDTSRERVVAYLASSFAGLTLLLASLGIYGVLTYDVARRTIRETKDLMGLV